MRNPQNSIGDFSGLYITTTINPTRFLDQATPTRMNRQKISLAGLSDGKEDWCGLLGLVCADLVFL